MNTQVKPKPKKDHPWRQYHLSQKAVKLRKLGKKQEERVGKHT